MKNEIVDTLITLMGVGVFKEHLGNMRESTNWGDFDNFDNHTGCPVNAFRQCLQKADGIEAT